MNKKFEHYIATKDIKERLRSLTSSSSSSAADFTILSYSLDARDSSGVAALRARAEAYPKEFIRHLVCMEPARLIHHEILAALQAHVKLDEHVDDDEQTFKEAYRFVDESLGQMNNNLALQSVCSELHTHLMTALDVHFNAIVAARESENASLFSEEELKKMDAIYQEISVKMPWSTNNESLKAVCTQCWLARIYVPRAQAIVGPVVKKHIDLLCKNGTLDRLPYVSKTEGVALFTTGGVASGKGSCLRSIEETLKTRAPTPVLWNEMVHHNADRIKPFLLDPLIDNHAYSQYTYEEALFVKERVMTLINERAQIEQAYPHFMHDQTKLKAAELLEANRRYDTTIIAAISTDAETAIERAYKRGSQTNRFEHTEGLLGSHQAVPGELMKAINQDSLFDCNVSVVMYDNNGLGLVMFASIDMRTRVICVYDEAALENWMKKENINPKAETAQTLYSSAGIRSKEDYFLPLTAKGFQLEVKEEQKMISTSLGGR